MAHWTDSVKAENERLRAEIATLRAAPSQAAFAREVGDNIMTMLANTQFKNWPDIAQTAFFYAAKRQPTTAHFYKENLP